MGLHSHERKRIVGAIISPPPAPRKRKCQGQILVTGFSKIEWLHPHGSGLYRRVWVDDHYRQCRSSASPYITEVSYCAHHMPLEWIALANTRAQLWNQLAIESWAHVLDQCPAAGVLA